MEDGGVRKFRRSPKSAMRWVDGADELAGDGRELLFRKFGRGPVIEAWSQPRFEKGCILLDGFLFLRIHAGDLLDHLLEPGRP